MRPELQAKLLRALEEKTFKRVGSSVDIQIDVRIIAATNRNLSEDVAAGTFREDLYYRLCVLPVHLPPLRERQNDIPLLVKHFTDRFNKEFKKAVLGIEPEAIEALKNFEWPGNIRELRNLLERAVLLADEELLTVDDFSTLNGITGQASSRITLPLEGIPLEEIERNLLSQALERTAWNHTKAGRLLGINRDQVRYRIEKFGLIK